MRKPLPIAPVSPDFQTVALPVFKVRKVCIELDVCQVALLRSAVLAAEKRTWRDFRAGRCSESDRHLWDEQVALLSRALFSFSPSSAEVNS